RDRAAADVELLGRSSSSYFSTSSAATIQNLKDMASGAVKAAATATTGKMGMASFSTEQSTSAAAPRTSSSPQAGGRSSDTGPGLQKAIDAESRADVDGENTAMNLIPGQNTFFESMLGHLERRKGNSLLVPFFGAWRVTPQMDVEDDDDAAPGYFGARVEQVEHGPGGRSTPGHASGVTTEASCYYTLMPNIAFKRKKIEQQEATRRKKQQREELRK
ncbi:unnamed protein product, partial [Amoebophrya sp. A120]